MHLDLRGTAGALPGQCPGSVNSAKFGAKDPSFAHLGFHGWSFAVAPDAVVLRFPVRAARTFANRENSSTTAG
jgi:hypothetical protein